MKHKINDLYTYITAFLKTCPFSDDELINQNGVINNEKFQFALNSFINQIEQNYDNITDKSFENKKDFEKDRLQETNSKSKKLLYFYQLCEDIYNVLATLNPPYPNDQDLYFKLAFNGVQHFRAITTLYVAGCDYSIIPLYRTLYENLIIFLFIAKNPILQNDFIEHFHIDFHKILEDSQTVTTEAQTNFHSAVDSHLEGFEKTYGWTAKVIEKKADRKLEYMAEKVGYLSYSPVYKLACNFVHSSSLAITVSNVEKPADDFTYLFIDSAIDFIVDHLVTLAQNISIPKSSYLIIMNILYHVKDDLLKS